MSNPFIKFQIHYLKAYLKHTAFVGRENKIIFNAKSRLNREYNKIYNSLDMKSSKEERLRASNLMTMVEKEIQSLYKSLDIDSRFEWRNSLYEKFPHFIRYKKDGVEKIFQMTSDMQVTAAHILYNRLREKKPHLKDKEKENEYIHPLTYWTERLAFLYEEECSRQVRRKVTICEVEGGNGGSSAEAGERGGVSHG